MNPLQSTPRGNEDVFVTKLNDTGAVILFSTYLGGSGGDSAGLAIAADGNVYLAGATNSADFPTVNPLQASLAGGADAFVAKISIDSVLAASVKQPINADGSSVFSANRGVVPVKFTLTSDGVPTCDLPSATISLTRTSGNATGLINESQYLTSADNGSNFRIVDCQYLYNLGTKSVGPGTYLVEIKISGTTVGSATFGLR